MAQQQTSGSGPWCAVSPLCHLVFMVPSSYVLTSPPRILTGKFQAPLPNGWCSPVGVILQLREEGNHRGEVKPSLCPPFQFSSNSFMAFSRGCLIGNFIPKHAHSDWLGPVAKSLRVWRETTAVVSSGPSGRLLQFRPWASRR